MIKKPVFCLNENKIVLPWRDYIFSGKHIMLVTAFLVSVVIFSGIIENMKPVKYLTAATACVVLTPALLYFIRYWCTEGPLTTPFTVNASGILAPTFFYKSYIPWPDIARVEHIWSMLGPNFAPIENNLIIYKKNGGSKRLFIPELTPEEKESFFTIMQNLSKHHGFELVIH